MRRSSKLALLLIAGPVVSGLVAGSGLWRTRSALGAEVVEASDAQTWRNLITGKHMKELWKHHNEEIQKLVRSGAVFSTNVPEVKLQGRLIALLGNIGATASEGQEEKARVYVALREAGLALVGAAKIKSYPNAKEAAEIIRRFPSIDPAESAEPAPWLEVLPLPILMKWVEASRKAVPPATESRDAMRRARLNMIARTRLLAGLAIVAGKVRPNDDWTAWVTELREGAMTISERFEKRDADGARAASESLEKTCAACHKIYRKRS